MAVRGTKHRTSITDYYMACRYCGKLFYYPRYVNGESVKCPYCSGVH